MVYREHLRATTDVKTEVYFALLLISIYEHVHEKITKLGSD